MEFRKPENMGARLKSVVEELQERIYKLKIFDSNEQVNAYCDELENQVIVTVESIIDTVNRFQKELFDEIDAYRRARLRPVALSKASDYYNFKSDQLNQDLTTLTKDIEAFESKCSSLYAQTFIYQETFRSALNQAGKYEQRAKAIRRKIRHETFGGNFLKFCERDAQIKRDFIGELVPYFRDAEDEMSQNDSKEASYIDLNAFNQLYSITSALFLSDGLLAVAPKDHPIFIWNPMTKKRVYTLEPFKIGKRLVEASLMVQLPSGHLAGADCSGNIVIWDLENPEYIKRLSLRQFDCHCVKFFRALPNGNLIAFWSNRYLMIAEQPLGKNVRYSFLESSPPIAWELLSNGQLATLHNSSQRDRDHGRDMRIYKFWSLENRGQLLSSSTFYIDDGFCANKDKFFKIIPNGDVVVCFSNGAVQAYSLTNRCQLVSSFQHNYGQVVAVSQQPSGSVLFVHLNNQDSSIVVSDGQASSRVHLKTSTFSDSSDGRYLIARSCKDRLIIWQMSQ